MEDINSPDPSHIIHSASFFKPLMITFIGIVSTSVALLLYHYILVKFFLRRRPQQPITAANNHLTQPGNQQPLTKGVDQKILQTIPILPYSIEELGHQFRADQTECVVCLGELERGEMVRLLPNCKHAFHLPCIDQWFVAHSNCPICRSPMLAVKFDPPPAPQLPPFVDENRLLFQPAPPSDPEPEHRVITYTNGEDASSSRKQFESGGFLRHCGSLALPPIDQQKRRGSSRRRLITGLKRSLSLDQSYSVIIDIVGPNCSSIPSPKDDSVNSRLYRTRSVKNSSDSLPPKLPRSSSRLPPILGRKPDQILPY
ncbi:hypothetical protein M9H77_01915 [Catharanthus roseus]|uniref:Uncharacterized protein n=1 Tax=Catharanthus roseus TaxID=4058 RepID=A0ACC0C7B4_CATRO|nr:hypothetical protein M9H77_01915 [Catharanthus roseus]